MKVRSGPADRPSGLDRVRDPLGDLLAEGSRVMAEELGQDSQHFAMQVKGLELPAYDPRAAKICGLGYVTANRGGDHVTSTVIAPTFIDAPILLMRSPSMSTSASRISPIELVIAPLPKACTRPATVELCQRRAQWSILFVPILARKNF